MMFEFAGITAGRKVAVHPLAKAAIAHGQATDNPSEVGISDYTPDEANRHTKVMLFIRR